MNNSVNNHRSFPASIFLSPSEPRLRTGWRLITHFTLLAILVTLVSLPLFAIFSPDGQFSDEEFHFINAVALAIPVTASVYFARRWLDKRSFASLGLRVNARAVKDLLFGFGLMGFLMGLIFLAELSLGLLRFEGFAWQVEPAGRIVTQLIFWFFVFLLVGWGEELLVRGYWLQNLIEGTNLFWAVVISSVLFATGHSLNPDVNWIAVMGLFVAGLFFAYAFLRTRLLWLPVGAHIGWNFFEGPVFGFPVSGLDVFRLIRHTLQGPELVTGGLFGPEAGLILLPALALGAVLIHLYTRARD